MTLKQLFEDGKQLQNNPGIADFSRIEMGVGTLFSGEMCRTFQYTGYFFVKTSKPTQIFKPIALLNNNYKKSTLFLF